MYSELMMRLAGIIVSLVVGVVACNEPTAAGQNGVTATLESQGVRVVNNSDRPLAVFAVDADILALINWAKCSQPTPACLRLPAHGSILIPLEDIGLDARSIVVYTWAVVRGIGGSYTTEDVANFELRR